MTQAPTEASRARRAAEAKLPADLAKLRDRYLVDYPAEAARVAQLVQVPAGLRHLLGLRLDLDRADGLPRHYRDLATEAMLNETSPHGAMDGVERLVGDYARAARAGRLTEAFALVPSLRRFFTEPQIVELVLTLALARALDTFDALIVDLSHEAGSSPP